jgi:hypothetical protein
MGRTLSLLFSLQRLRHTHTRRQSRSIHQTAKKRVKGNATIAHPPLHYKPQKKRVKGNATIAHPPLHYMQLFSDKITFGCGTRCPYFSAAYSKKVPFFSAAAVSCLESARHALFSNVLFCTMPIFARSLTCILRTTQQHNTHTHKAVPFTAAVQSVPSQLSVLLFIPTTVVGGASLPPTTTHPNLHLILFVHVLYF